MLSFSAQSLLSPSLSHLPLFLSLSAEPTRSHDWDSVVSCHAGHSSAQTWSLQKCVVGRHSLSSKHADSGARPVVSNRKWCGTELLILNFSHYLAVKCVTLTGCGNFAILGMSTGHIEMFNIQSGIHRGEVGKQKF